MTCSVSGCYAMTFRRNLCRNHFYMWSDQLETAAPGVVKGDLRGAPAPTRTRERYAGPCRCETPQPQPVIWWGCFECAACGMPIPTMKG